MSSLQAWLMEAVQQGWLAESFQYAFMLNALIAAVILGPLLGGLGTLVIAKRLAFFPKRLGTQQSLASPSAFCSGKIRNRR